MRFVAVLLLCNSAYAISIPQIAGLTTIALNVLEAPATVRKAKAAVKKIRHPRKKQKKQP